MAKGKKKPKKPAFKQPAPRAKRPDWVDPPTFEGGHLSWRFSSADAGGPWAWSEASKDSLKQIMGRLPAFENLQPGYGLKNVRSIVLVVKLAQSAKQRLRDLQRDDIEELYGWHIAGKERLWCAEYDGMMCVLWWDPEHQVYSVPKRHT